jgi:hypothetical protein
MTMSTSIGDDNLVRLDGRFEVLKKRLQEQDDLLFRVITDLKAERDLLKKERDIYLARCFRAQKVIDAAKALIHVCDSRDVPGRGLFSPLREALKGVE